MERRVLDPMASKNLLLALIQFGNISLIMVLHLAGVRVALKIVISILLTPEINT